MKILRETIALTLQMRGRRLGYKVEETEVDALYAFAIEHLDFSKKDRKERIIDAGTRAVTLFEHGILGLE